ncbi:MAG: UDP-N-acetylmuramoyl-L-alanine--D-glutamate ligase, partial [Pseudomonadota bacterium]
MDFSNKKILVVGLGKSGLSASRWLAGAGASVTVSEFREKEVFDQELLREISQRGIRLETGGHKRESFLGADMIVLSPGVPLDIPPLRLSKEKGIPILGEMGLAAGLMDIPIVAVTGTNGKSTVTTLIGALLENAGFSTFVGGNIGTPLMDYLSEGRRADYAVLEVSSFQLDTMEDFCPDVALILNISPDHLDRYPGYGAYVESKLKIFKNQGRGQVAIVNDDDEELARLVPGGDVSLLRYGLRKREHRQAFIDGGNLTAFLPGGEGIEIDIAGVKLRGEHNMGNLMGGVLAGLSLGLKREDIIDTIETFRGLPHRLEYVKSIRGVDFFNDSKATNVDAAVKAIESFKEPVILIAGGRHKGGDYSPLV